MNSYVDILRAYFRGILLAYNLSSIVHCAFLHAYKYVSNVINNNRGNLSEHLYTVSLSPCGHTFYHFYFTYTSNVLYL